VATVTGVTAARATQIENASVVGASIQGNDLVLVTKGGTQINVGRIIPPLVNSYPVGSIYMTDRAANPSTYMGGGTWVRWGKGRVPVSIDEAQAEFATLEGVAGEKTVALNQGHMPPHDHGGNTGYQSHDHSHTGYTDVQGAHAHNYFAPSTDSGAVGGSTIYRQRTATVTDTQGAHSHNVQTYGASSNHYHSIPVNGSGISHQNLQPYINVYMWKRTA
jgi:microcystin-dependent protein